MSEISDQVGTAVVELAAITIDCAEAAPITRFYSAALGGTVERETVNGSWIRVGGLLLLIRVLDDYRPPTWPQADIPMQIHFEFYIDDMTAAERRLHEFGATTCEFQPNREEGNLVMLDPAGHPFCIGTR